MDQHCIYSPWIESNLYHIRPWMCNAHFFVFEGIGQVVEVAVAAFCCPWLSGAGRGNSTDGYWYCSLTASLVVHTTPIETIRFLSPSTDEDQNAQVLVSLSELAYTKFSLEIELGK